MNVVRKILQSLRLYSIVVKVYNYVFGFLKNGNRIKNQKRKRKFVRKLQKNLHYENFVETGTYKGDMVESVRGLFENIYSIELDDTLYKQAVLRFEGIEKIKLFHGNSSEILPTILPKIKSTIFWLDAHSNHNTPIISELKTIFNHTESHVILIDDAHAFNGTNNYPTISFIETHAEQNNYELLHFKSCDVLALCPTV